MARHSERRVFWVPPEIVRHIFPQLGSPTPTFIEKIEIRRHEVMGKEP